MFARAQWKRLFSSKNGIKSAAEDSFVMDYAKAQRTKYDPLIAALSGSRQPVEQSSSPRRDQRRNRTGKDQALSNALYRNQARKDVLSFKMWTRTEEEVLVKSVLEQCCGQQIEDLSSFVNVYDNQSRELLHRPNLSNLSRKYSEDEEDNSMKSSGRLEGDQLALSRIPPVVDLNKIDWQLVSAELPYRSAKSCMNHFRWLVHPDHRTPVRHDLNADCLHLSHQDSTDTSSLSAKGSSKIGKNETKNKEQKIEHKTRWTRQDLENLRLAMIRYGSPMYSAKQQSLRDQGQIADNDMSTIIDWNAISRLVGKSQLQCQRKWLHFRQD